MAGNIKLGFGYIFFQWQQISYFDCVDDLNFDIIKNLVALRTMEDTARGGWMILKKLLVFSPYRLDWVKLRSVTQIEFQLY